MIAFNRFLACAAAATLIGAAAPQTTSMPDKEGEAGKVFPYIEHFLALPPASRTDFTVAYFVKRDGKAMSNVSVTLIDGDRRIPIPIGEDGRVARLPTLAQVKAHDLVTFDVPGKAHLAVRIGLAPVAPPSTSMDADRVERAIWQANSAIHHLAGMFSVVVPRLKTALFDGAEGGIAVLEDGSTVPLPVKKDGPYYEPAKLRNAVTLKFTRAAGHIDIE